jgi:hypothetical protein
MKDNLTNSEFKRIPILYNFNHSKMGFQNQITVTARNNEEAIEAAKREVSQVYGSKMLSRFTFKPAQ